MKQIITKLLIGIGIFASSQLNAQSLQTFIEQALEQNYQIKIVRNTAQIAENNNTVGAAGMLPSVGVNGQYTQSYNNTEQQLADGSLREGSNAENTNLSLSALANWTVFKGFSVHAKRNQLEALEQIGKLNAQFYIEQTISDIVSVYYQLVYERKLLENYRASLAVSNFRNTIAQKQKSLGMGTIMDYGQALVDYQTDSIRVLAQETQVKNLEIDLNRVINQNLEQTITIVNPKFDLKAIPAKQVLLDKLSEHNTQLETSHLQELVAENQLRIDRAQRYPQVDLFAGYQYSKSTAAVGFISSNLNYGPTVGVSVSFNLFNGGTTNRTIKNSVLYTQNASLSKEDLDISLQAEVLKMYEQYHTLSAQVSLAKSNLKSVEKVFVAAEEQLRTGAINGYDFRLTQQTVLNTKLTLTQLQYTLKVIEVNIQRLTGEVLTNYVK